MSLATAAPAPLTRECGNRASGSSVLRKLTAAAGLYEAQQQCPDGAPDDKNREGAAVPAWLQQQHIHSTMQDGDPSACGGAGVEGARGERDDDVEEDNRTQPLQCDQQQNSRPADSEDAHLHRLLASEGLMRCETLNLFRAQLQQLSRRKDGLMPRADGSFPENWLLLAWEYQGLAEEVMSCQRWPGKYPEGLLRCVAHQVLYLKHRLEAFPTMTGAERDQFRRLYVLAALGIIAKLKLVTFCWTFVELKRGGEMAEHVAEAAQQQAWQLQLSASTTESPGNMRAVSTASNVTLSGQESLAASASMMSDSPPAVEAPSGIGLQKMTSPQQVCLDSHSSVSEASRSFRKKDNIEQIREEQQPLDVRMSDPEGDVGNLAARHLQESSPLQGKQRNQGEQRKSQAEEGMAGKPVENGRGSAPKKKAGPAGSLTASVPLEVEADMQGKYPGTTDAGTEDRIRAALDGSRSYGLFSQRIEVSKDCPSTSRANEARSDGPGSSKKAEGKQREFEGSLSDVQDETKSEGPGKTKYTTRSGRKTHRVKADVS